MGHYGFHNYGVGKCVDKVWPFPPSTSSCVPKDSIHPLRSSGQDPARADRSDGCPTRADRSEGDSFKTYM